MGRIELPGEMPIEMPSQTVQYLAAIQQQLQQVTQLLNVLAGQLDMGLRIASGQHSKHEVKVKFEENDKQVRLAQAAATLAAQADEPAGPED